MKKVLLPAAVCVCMLLGATSCSTVTHTSQVVPVQTEVQSVSTAQLNVSPRKISYTYRPSKAVRRGGDKNVVRMAVAQALKENNNADVLVGMQYEMKKTRNIFGVSSVKYVIVEGYPATYTNINPVFVP